ncbi:amino acid ABC transporter permease [Streptomyces sp. JV176]|uniref:amino acid ABC transporter permease n=1 Tax=Streptomyces sp. JV176 TaxID=858630 RepID=UPI002E790DEF|nr:amino acid ABC transporter permease [Streptomyces sp. JV176]MEE1797649.1 amino acid ABC transporter permease [Streptomyces sp. JV176]
MSTVPGTRVDPASARTTGPTLTVKPLRHPVRTACGVLASLCLAGVVWSVAKNPNLEWATVGQYLFHERTLSGLGVTVYLTVVCMVIAVLGGTLLAIMKLSDSLLLRVISDGYVWLFRGVPLLVQIIFWGFLGAFYQRLIIGIPFTDVVFYSAETNRLVTATVAAVLALGLNAAAYAAEIVRGGISSVDAGQREAAYALGLTPGQTMRRIVLPQAMRVIVPPLGNEVITMMKMTALVSVIAGNDLMTNLQSIYSMNFKVIPLLTVACLWYLTLTTALTLGQRYLERRFGRGVTAARTGSGPRTTTVTGGDQA